MIQSPSFLKTALHKLDAYSKPRPDTSGDLKGDSFFQAAFNGAVDGLYVAGPFGAAFTAGAAALGVGAEKIVPGHKWLAPVVGAVAGGALAAGLGAIAFAGSPLILTVATGALLGSYETLKASASAKIRDSGNGAMISAPFLPGPARLSGGLAGMVGAHCKTWKGKLAVGALTGLATGVGMSVLAAGMGALIPAAIVGTIAGAAGPFFGPRYSQLFRNLAADFGKPVKKLFDKIHPSDPQHPSKIKPKYFQLVGTVPAAFVKEGLKAVVISHGSLGNAAIGGVKEAIRQVHVVMEQKDSREKSAPSEDAKAPPAAPPAKKPEIPEPPR